MRRYSPHTHLRGRARWSVLALALTFLLSLFLTAGGAQAVVVSDQGASYGVVMPAGTSLPSGVTPDSSTAPCVDPAMQFTPDLTYLQATTPLCWRGGSVIHANETFALTWDPYRSYWSGTRGYVEQFLRDVADGSGTFSSPYALTSQYTDSTTLAPNSSFLVSSRAVNNSKYGGGCIDYGSVGGSDCQIGAGTTQGHDYPGTNGMGSCYVSGSTACLTDSDIQGEVNAIVGDTQLTTNHQAGYTPAVVVLTPPNAVVCLDSARTLCSANGSSTGFCSYHSQVNGIVYVVQPWTIYTGCDEPNLPALPQNPTPQQLATDAGSRLVGPLSQGQIDAIVNPGVSDGWIANSGAEMSDNNGCVPEGPTADTVSVGSGSYVLPREFDNGAAIASDPNTYGGCAPDVILSPTFVIPSAVNQGDVVEFDGSPTASTLIVPNAGYQWSFGDGTTATGPSVVHSYAAGGSYPVTLTVTDRGGNVAELSQTIVVLSSATFPPRSVTVSVTG